MTNDHTSVNTQNTRRRRRRAASSDATPAGQQSTVHPSASIPASSPSTAHAASSHIKTPKQPNNRDGVRSRRRRIDADAQCTAHSNREAHPRKALKQSRKSSVTSARHRANPSQHKTLNKQGDIGDEQRDQQHNRTKNVSSSATHPQKRTESQHPASRSKSRPTSATHKTSGQRMRNKPSKGPLAASLYPEIIAVKEPYSSEQITSHAFYALGLDDALTSATINLGFTQPTPIQAQAIPPILAGHDLIAHAQTGTGKTAAFILPALQLISARNCPARQASCSSAHTHHHPRNASSEAPLSPSASPQEQQITSGLNHHKQKPSKRAHQHKQPELLVLTPTRELATQIGDVAQAVSQFSGHRVAHIIGGARMDKQIRQINAGCDALIATPGRLLDLVHQQVLDLSAVRILVLDEADRMLDMGFWPHVKEIERLLKRKRQTLFFSATTTGRVNAYAKTLLNNPITVSVAPQNTTAITINEEMMCVVDMQKLDLLFTLIQREHPQRILIFCKTKQRVDLVAQRLSDLKLSVGVMHADRAQKQRERALSRFAQGALSVLVATDVMSRGIDISNIDWVINYDVPADPEDYVHRIGRTGRAGQTGRAITLVAPEEISLLREIEYFTQHLLTHVELADFDYDAQRIIPSSSRRSTKGGTGSRRMGARRHGRSL